MICLPYVTLTQICILPVNDFIFIGIATILVILTYYFIILVIVLVTALSSKAQPRIDA